MYMAAFVATLDSRATPENDGKGGVTIAWDDGTGGTDGFASPSHR